jgi:hypothetical protein
MFSNRFAFAAFATACLTAAASGGYFATRQNATPTASPAATSPAPVAVSPTTAKPAERPVEETEAVVGDKDPAGAKKPTSSSGSASSEPVAPRATRRTTAPAASPASSADASTSHQDRPPDRTTPVSAAPAPPSAATPPPAGDAAASAIRPDDRPAAEASRASEPPAKVYDELVISPDSVIGLQIDRTISTSLARVEDRVDARVTRDVRVGEKVAIPSGARAIGSVTEVDRGGKFKERARLGIRFHTLVLADGTRVPMSTETIYRDGDAPASAQKVGGGAVAGAILGAILGGAKGAAIGGAAGAGAGAASAAAGDRSTATFPAGTQTTVRILSPVTITVER